MIYLASPYSDPDPAVRHGRYLWACRAAAVLMQQRQMPVFSPIAHSHSVARYGNLDEMDVAFWKAQDEVFLSMATEIVVLRIDGYEGSRGVAHEVNYATERGLPVTYMEPSEAMEQVILEREAQG